LYKKIVFNAEVNYFIVSASFEDYIKPIFPDFVRVIGSKLTRNSENMVTIERNCFGFEKVLSLRSFGINQIDELYTDSYDDLPLVRISKKVIIVSKGDLIECNNTAEFKRFFGK